MRYLPHTEAEIKSMLERIGVTNTDALFESIPAHVRTKALALEEALDEPRLMKHLSELSEKNRGNHKLSFLGGGMTTHHIPPAVDQLLLRSEFYTAYTPYQAEVSQGTLQSIFEFQTLVAELFGLEVANASMYCGASSVAEAALMTTRIKKRKRIVMSAALHPEYIQVTRTYISGNDELEIVVIPTTSAGGTDLDALEKSVDESIASVIFGYPNFYGVVEDAKKIVDIAHKVGALAVSATSEPYALALIESPGAIGVDIAVGEGQALSVPPQFGGPGVGLFATKKEFVRQMPGRLAGQTVDQDDKRGFVLTLSTREQHIRRERATSNICTNHGLIALSMTMRLAMLGKRGFEVVAEQCLAKSEYVKAEIAKKAPQYRFPYGGKTFNEFTIAHEKKSAKEIMSALSDEGILVGPSMDRFADGNASPFLIACTELHERADLDRLVDTLAKL